MAAKIVTIHWRFLRIQRSKV